MPAATARRRVLLVGPYGGTNLGDDAILTALLAVLDEMHVEAEVSCSDPPLVAAATGRSALPLLDYRAGETSVLRELPRFDAVIIGGGQQLAEPRLPNPLWGHLARSCHMARHARRLGKPVILWGVGIDWPLAGLSRWLVRRTLGHAGVTIALRDAASLRTMAQLLHGRGATLHRVADAAFLLPAGDAAHGRRHLCALLGEHDTGQRFAIISPAHDKVSDTAYYSALVAAGEELAARGLRVVGWHSDLQHGYDMALRQMPLWQRIPGFTWLPPLPYATEEVTAMLGAARLLVSARLHPAILAAGQGTQVVGIARSLKMTEILADAGIPFLAAGACGGDVLRRLATAVLEGRKASDPAAYERQRRLAQQGIAIVRDALMAGAK